MFGLTQLNLTAYDAVDATLRRLGLEMAAQRKFRVNFTIDIAGEPKEMYMFITASDSDSAARQARGNAPYSIAIKTIEPTEDG